MKPRRSIFKQRCGEVDWKIIESIDVEEIIAENNITDLQTYLNHFIFRTVPDIDINRRNVTRLETNLSKWTQILQLTSEYLLLTQEEINDQMMKLQREKKKDEKRIEHLQRRLEKERMSRVTIEQEKEVFERAFKVCVGMLGKVGMGEEILAMGLGNNMGNFDINQIQMMAMNMNNNNVNHLNMNQGVNNNVNHTSNAKKEEVKLNNLFDMNSSIIEKELKEKKKEKPKSTITTPSPISNQPYINTDDIIKNERGKFMDRERKKQLRRLLNLFQGNMKRMEIKAFSKWITFTEQQKFQELQRENEERLKEIERMNNDLRNQLNQKSVVKKPKKTVEELLNETERRVNIYVDSILEEKKNERISQLDEKYTNHLHNTFERLNSGEYFQDSLERKEMLRKRNLEERINHDLNQSMRTLGIGNESNRLKDENYVKLNQTLSKDFKLSESIDDIEYMISDVIKSPK